MGRYITTLSRINSVAYLTSVVIWLLYAIYGTMDVSGFDRAQLYSSQSYNDRRGPNRPNRWFFRLGSSPTHAAGGYQPSWRKPFKDIKAWLAQRGVILQVPRSLQQAVLRPQISPVIFIGAEPQYPLAFSGKPKNAGMIEEMPSSVISRKIRER